MGKYLTTSSAYTKQSGGVSASMKWTMIDKTTALVRESGMNEEFWAQAIKHAVYLHKKTISPVLSIKNPARVVIVEYPR